MSASEAEKAAQRDCASGLPELAVLPGFSEFVATLPSEASQTPRRSERTLATIRIKGSTQMRVTVAPGSAGGETIFFRRWFLSGCGDWRPSAAGIDFPASFAGEIVTALLVAARTPT